LPSPTLRSHGFYFNGGVRFALLLPLILYWSRFLPKFVFPLFWYILTFYFPFLFCSLLFFHFLPFFFSPSTRVGEPENLKTVPVPTFYLNTVPVPVPAPVPGHIHAYTYTYTYTYMCISSQMYTYAYTKHIHTLNIYLYLYLYLDEKEIIKILINFSELLASFPCTRNRNRILNTVPVPETPNEYGSDRFRFQFRLRNLPSTYFSTFTVIYLPVLYTVFFHLLLFFSSPSTYFLSFALFLIP
jgi:hypothetical protein